MKNHFIIPIHIQTNKLAEEKICVGLIYVYDNKHHIKYSEEKLELTKQFIDDDVVDSVRESIEKLKLSNTEDIITFVKNDTYENKENILSFGNIRNITKEKFDFDELFKLYTEIN